MSVFSRSGFLLALLLLGGLVHAQTVERGVVQEYNGKEQKTPLADVQILVLHAGSTISGRDGSFTLEFLTGKPGDPVSYKRIEKPGYELFNTEALEQWYISNSGKPFVVVMCKSARFKEIRDHYNGIASASYAEQLKKEERALRQEVSAGKLQEKDYQRRVAELRNYYDEQLENLDTYIDKFARIDLSELSPEEQAIVDLVQAGDLEAAMEAYEKKDFLSLLEKESRSIEGLTRTREVLAEAREQKGRKREELYASISRQVHTYMLAGGKANVGKAKDLLRKCALTDTTNLLAVFDYAVFAKDQKEYADAERFFQMALGQAPNETIRTRIQFNLGIIYALTHRFLQAEPAMLEALAREELLSSLIPERNQAELAFLQANVGSLYQTMNEHGKALHYLVQAEESYRSLYEADPDAYIEIYAQNLMNLGIVYRARADYARSEASYQKALRLYRELADRKPEKHLQNLAVCQLNHALLFYFSQDYAAAEKEFQTALGNMKSVVSRNPSALMPELGMTYNGLGLLYRATGRPQEALENYLQAKEIYQELYGSAPEVHRYMYARVLANLGILYGERGQGPAKEMLTESNALFSGIPKAAFDAYREDIARVSFFLGEILAGDSLQEALPYYERAHRILVEDSRIEANPELQAVLMETQIKLGFIHMDESPSQSESYLARALPKIKKRFMASPDEYRVQYALVLVGLVKDYGSMLETDPSAYEKLLKYVPAAFTQCSILESRSPGSFTEYFQLVKDIKAAIYREQD